MWNNVYGKNNLESMLAAGWSEQSVGGIPKRLDDNLQIDWISNIWHSYNIVIDKKYIFCYLEESLCVL